MEKLSVAEVIPQLYIAIATALFNLLLLVVMEQRSMRSFPSRRAFYYVVAAVLFGSVLSCTATLLRWSDIDAPVVLVSALQLLAYLGNTLVAYAFSVFCIVYLYINRGLILRREMNAIIAGLVLTIAFSVGQAFAGPMLQVNYVGATLGLYLFYFSFYADTVTATSRDADKKEQPAKETADIRKGYVNKRSIIVTIFGIISALILGSYILLGVLLYYRSEEMFMRELKGNALSNAKTIAASIDSAAFSRLYDGCQGNEDFMNVLHTLEIFRDNAGLQYVYTTWYDENGIPVMCVDSDPIAPGDMGDDLGYAEATHLALHGTAAVYDTPVTDDWGAHLSAFAPIIYEGEVYGAVGVDLDYSWVSGQLRGIVLLIVIICALCFAVTMAILISLAAYLKKRFRLLDEKIDVLSYDSEELRIIDGLASGDEFGMIAAHINEVFRRNMAAQQAEADKLRSAMAEVEHRADERIAKYAAQAEALSVREEVLPLNEEALPMRTEAAPHKEEVQPLPDTDGELTKEEAIRRVREETPAVMASYRGLLEILRPYFGDTDKDAEADEDLPEMDIEELQELYEAIGEFAGIYDSDGINSMLKQTEGYAIPEAERERFEKIRECAKASDWKGITDALKGVYGE